jgi:hypothetical protein
MKARAAVTVFGLSYALNIALMLRHPSWLMAPAALAGWYAADFLSGAVHMYMDYRPCVAEPGLAQLFFYAGSRESDDYLALKRATMARINPFERVVFDFKVHHPRPLALGRRALVPLIISTVLFLSLPASLALNALALLAPVPGGAMAALMVMLGAGTFSQYFHATLHRDANPAFVRVMRRLGLLMRPQAHEAHHATLKQDFATLSGWSNPALNLVFRGLQRRGLMDEAGLEPM